MARKAEAESKKTSVYPMLQMTLMSEPVWLCPNCNREIAPHNGYKRPRCQWCGQALIWNVKKEKISNQYGVSVREV